MLCVTLIASAAFIIVAVDAFRRSGSTVRIGVRAAAVFHFLRNPCCRSFTIANTPEGREALNIPANGTQFVNFRVRPGDDTSCLNLYQPRNPKIIAPPTSFIDDNRFTFQSTLDANEKNPWLLLNREFPDGAIPVITDANSLTYVLHLKIGEDLVVDHSPQPLRLRIVGALLTASFKASC